MNRITLELSTLGDLVDGEGAAPSRHASAVPPPRLLETAPSEAVRGLLCPRESAKREP